MPKPLNPKCQLCAKLPTVQAKLLHGAEGDGCWDANVCHNRRSFYRHRRDSQAKMEVLQVEPPVTHFAVLYLYKETGDRPLHALEAQLWCGQKPICRLEPIHCFGLTAGKVKAYTEKVLQAFSEEYQISLYQYKEMFEINPTHCPVRPCPLHPELSG